MEFRRVEVGPGAMAAPGRDKGAPPPFCDVRSRAAAGAPVNAKDASRLINPAFIICPLEEASARVCSGLECGEGGILNPIFHVAAFSLMAPFFPCSWFS